MAVKVKTKNPKELLSAIKDAIKAGEIDTWSVDADGDFTHSPEQWKNKAWMRPIIREEELRFAILGPAEQNLPSSTYGIYHGRFVEMLLNHFDKKFEEAAATALPMTIDRIHNK